MNNGLDQLVSFIKKVQKMAETQYGEFELKNHGFYSCNLFDSLPTHHEMIIIGLNLGGDPLKETFDNANECNFFLENPLYNEYLHANYKFITSVRKLFRISFGDEYYKAFLYKTFGWNLCPYRHINPWSRIDNESQTQGFNAGFPILEEIVSQVKPKLILSTVGAFNHIKSKIGLNIEPSQLVIQKGIYYYRLENVQVNNFSIKKFIGIPHLSNAHINESGWKKFGNYLKNDYLEFL